MLARFDYEKALRKQLGERSERDFASAMGASATQKRSLRNATPNCRSDGGGEVRQWWCRRKPQRPSGGDTREKRQRKAAAMPEKGSSGDSTTAPTAGKSTSASAEVL